MNTFTGVEYNIEHKNKIKRSDFLAYMNPFNSRVNVIVVNNHSYIESIVNYKQIHETLEVG